jgi:hypothetical protein
VRRSPTPSNPNLGQVPVALWIGLGILMGVGLHFLQLPPRLLPLFVGAGVALFMVLVLRYVLVTTEEVHALAPAAPGGARVREGRPPNGRPEGKRPGDSRRFALLRRQGPRPPMS